MCISPDIDKGDDIPKAVIETFQCAEASRILPFLNDDVSLKVIDRHYRGRKEQVVENLAQFFSTRTICSFELKHSSIRDGAGFFIGSLATKDSRYRINCFFKNRSNHLYIHQIRIDNADD